MLYHLVNTVDGSETPFVTSLDCSREGNVLLFRFSAENSRLFSYSDKDNDELYRGDVVEVFFRTGSDPNRYYELEVAPNGAVLFGAVEYYRRRISFKLLPRMFDVEVEREKSGYKAFIRIDLDRFGGETGEVWFNAFRIETEGGTPEKNLLALSPTMCRKFHRPKAFVKLQ